jgi:hypothetical protein
MYHRGPFALSRHLALPRRWRHVNDYLQAQDADLRIRASVERPGWFVLERRCRRRPAVCSAMHDQSDMHVQRRDGFIHVAIVNPEWLNKPWNILRALRTEGADTWAYTNTDVLADEQDYEERWQRETRRRRRHEDGVAYYREQFDILSRLGNLDGTEKTRFTNPGPTPQTSAAA